jgi:type IV pilus assembly protein PilM
MIDVGSSKVTLSILEKREFVFTRSEDFSFVQFPFLIQEDSNPIDEQKIIMNQEENILSLFKESLLVVICRLLQFFSSCDQQKEIDQIILTGGGALVPKVAEWVQDHFNIDTKLLNPFEGMKFSEEINEKDLIKIAPLFSLSAGLALREIH